MVDTVKATAKHKDGKQYLEGYVHPDEFTNTDYAVVFYRDEERDDISACLYVQNRADWTIERVEPTSAEIVARLKPGSVFEEWGKSTRSYHTTWFVQNGRKIINLEGNTFAQDSALNWEHYIIVIKEEVL